MKFPPAEPILKSEISFKVSFLWCIFDAFSMAITDSFQTYFLYDGSINFTSASMYNYFIFTFKEAQFNTLAALKIIDLQVISFFI